MRFPTSVRLLTSTAGAIALIAALSSCGGNQEKREYSVPDALCGISIDSRALTPFLPSGKKLTTEAKRIAPNVTKCRVVVDGELAAITSQEWWNRISIVEFAGGLTLDTPDHQTDDGKYAYSGNQAFGRTDGCNNKEHPGKTLYTAIQASESKHSDANAMKHLIIDYTHAVATQQCT
jgi:hypothetical protein